MPRLLVAAAVIRRNDRILIAQRPTTKHQGGLWEFPGGKVEAGEAVEQALTRELEEELGLQPLASRPLIRINYDYPDKAVCLDVREVSAFRGEPHGREGQPVRWVSPDELVQYTFPPANRPIVTAARLPSTYTITPPGLTVAEYDAWLAARLGGGMRMVLLRAPHLPEADYRALAQAWLYRCRTAGVRLMLHGAPALLAEVPAEGVHLPAVWLARAKTRPCAGEHWLAVSVHTPHELAQAQALGADFLTVSPVAATRSHPDAAPLGWQRFAALAQTACVPVYALGGLGPADVEQAWLAGGQGVAGISGF